MDSVSAHCLLVTSDTSGTAPLAACISEKQVAEVVVATSLVAAREAMQATRFDILIIDNELPDGDGLSLAANFGRRRWFMLGQDLNKARLMRAMRFGARDVFERPLNPAAICERVRKAIDRQRRIHRAARRHARLRELSVRIIKDRRQVRRKVDLVCRDLVGAYRALAEKVVALGDSASQKS